MVLSAETRNAITRRIEKEILVNYTDDSVNFTKTILENLHVKTMDLCSHDLLVRRSALRQVNHFIDDIHKGSALVKRVFLTDSRFHGTSVMNNISLYPQNPFHELCIRTLDTLAHDSNMESSFLYHVPLSHTHTPVATPITQAGEFNLNMTFNISLITTVKSFNELVKWVEDTMLLIDRTSNSSRNATEDKNINTSISVLYYVLSFIRTVRTMFPNANFVTMAFLFIEKIAAFSTNILLPYERGVLHGGLATVCMELATMLFLLVGKCEHIVETNASCFFYTIAFDVRLLHFKSKILSLLIECTPKHIRILDSMEQDASTDEEIPISMLSLLNQCHNFTAEVGIQTVIPAFLENPNVPTSSNTYTLDVRRTLGAFYTSLGNGSIEVLKPILHHELSKNVFPISQYWLPFSIDYFRSDREIRNMAHATMTILLRGIVCRQIYLNNSETTIPPTYIEPDTGRVIIVTQNPQFTVTERTWYDCCLWILSPYIYTGGRLGMRTIHRRYWNKLDEMDIMQLGGVEQSVFVNSQPNGNTYIYMLRHTIPFAQMMSTGHDIFVFNSVSMALKTRDVQQRPPSPPDIIELTTLVTGNKQSVQVTKGRIQIPKQYTWKMADMDFVEFLLSNSEFGVYYGLCCANLDRIDVMLSLYRKSAVIHGLGDEKITDLKKIIMKQILQNTSQRVQGQSWIQDAKTLISAKAQIFCVSRDP